MPKSRKEPTTASATDEPAKEKKTKRHSEMPYTKVKRFSKDFLGVYRRSSGRRFPMSMNNQGAMALCKAATYVLDEILQWTMKESRKKTISPSAIYNSIRNDEDMVKLFISFGMDTGNFILTGRTPSDLISLSPRMSKILVDDPARRKARKEQAAAANAAANT